MVVNVWLFQFLFFSVPFCPFSLLLFHIILFMFQAIILVTHSARVHWICIYKFCHFEYTMTHIHIVTRFFFHANWSRAKKNHLKRDWNSRERETIEPILYISFEILHSSLSKHNFIHDYTFVNNVSWVFCMNRQRYERIANSENRFSLSFSLSRIKLYAELCNFRHFHSTPTIPSFLFSHPMCVLVFSSTLVLSYYMAKVYLHRNPLCMYIYVHINNAHGFFGRLSNYLIFRRVWLPRICISSNVLFCFFSLSLFLFPGYMRSGATHFSERTTISDSVTMGKGFFNHCHCSHYITCKCWQL